MKFIKVTEEVGNNTIFVNLETVCSIDKSTNFIRFANEKFITVTDKSMNEILMEIGYAEETF